MGHLPPSRLAANLKWLFTEEPFDHRFDRAAAEGFTAVEVPEPYGRSAVDLRDLAEAAGTKIVLINTPLGRHAEEPSFSPACAPGFRAQFQDDFRLALEYATVGGTDLIHIVAGRRPEGVSRDRAFATYVRNISWASDVAADEGVRVVLEMQNQRAAPRFVLESQEMAAAAAEAAGDNTGLLLDTYHLQVQDGDVTTNLKKFLPRTFHIQISDAPDRTEPGTGELRWSHLARTIADSGYAGWIGCEFTPTGTTAGILNRLDSLT